MGVVLVVDDVAGNRALLRAFLSLDGHVVQAACDGDEAVRMVRAEPPDLVLMDVMMPKVDGFEACRALKLDPHTRLIPIVLVTGLTDSESRLQGIEAGADDFVAKPFNGPELRARVRSLLRIKRFTDDLDSAESMIMSLALTVEARDPSTGGHCQRLAGYASDLGRALGLEEDDISALKRGGYLHDVGKIAVPDAVLLKPGRLTPDEYQLIKRHTLVGDELCADMRLLRKVRPIVRHHHERRDGSGYPDGLRGDSIPLLAQVMAVVDVFDALTTPRPYRSVLSFAQAAGELRREAARGLHRADLVDTFLLQVASLTNVSVTGAPLSAPTRSLPDVRNHGPESPR